MLRKLQTYKNKLLDLRAELRDRIDRTPDVIHEETRPPGEHEIPPSEGIDTEIAQERTAQDVLREINSALGRLDAGTYGRCQECGAEIPADRLDAVPYAAFCRACEQKAEVGKVV